MQEIMCDTCFHCTSYIYAVIIYLFDFILCRDFFIVVSPLIAILFLPDVYALHSLHFYLYMRPLYYYDELSELDRIEYLFDTYYAKISQLYGHKCKLLIVHLHLHLKEQVLKHGALSITSCFSRESYLGLALRMCHGKKFILQQFMMWYSVDQSLPLKKVPTVDEIFKEEKFDDRYLDTYLIGKYRNEIISELIKANSSFNANSLLKYYSRYRRGFKTFHSIANTRAGRASSATVFIVNDQCGEQRNKCFGEVIAYFQQSNSFYAFIKCFTCLDTSITFTLSTVSVPYDITVRINRYYTLCDLNKYFYMVVETAKIIKKALRLPWNQNQFFAFPDIVYDFDHD